MAWPLGGLPSPAGLRGCSVSWTDVAPADLGIAPVGQITLSAWRFQPASGVPAAPNRRPLPFGRLPLGASMLRATAATDSGVSSEAPGITSWNSAQAPENPASAGALISVWYRCWYKR